MSELNAELAADVVAACQAGTEEATGALNRALDGEFTLAVGEPASYAADAPPTGFDGPGLAVLMKFGEVGLAAIIPESSGLLPEWYADPDPTGESKLSTLAQELSMLLVPESLMADSFAAARVEQVSSSLKAAEVADDAALVPLALGSGEEQAQLSVIWPLAVPDKLLPVAEEIDESVAEAPTPVAAAAVPTGPLDFSQLPGYSRSLLKISVPVRVVLASKKEALIDVVELAAGSIIQFDKGCEELLHLHVGDQPVAEGEAVKVGDKFGFRVTAMVMPEEHFMRVTPKSA